MVVELESLAFRLGGQTLRKGGRVVIVPRPPGHYWVCMEGGNVGCRESWGPQSGEG